ncbi:VIT-domain-containing protein [Aaosphaeria arxii CBS 175.79]|uniref:VIT-domain-containing protein n=1 Tax=Aaosphaeria arxii CBS 175.79 TaxID=1450172 RepID=A0A6A5Y667_9PLEO|nr:VIT-domain-containing protein [Aaosphaeria arxii CBS 175.79]KAF2020261.1 VIT-domain-containing protein [Aaosphaeria arxii CBS 175.79]
MSFFSNPSAVWHQHPSGLYFLSESTSKVYVPQIDVNVHSTIISTTSRTVLTQTYINPSDTKGIRELRYIFPLYDGVSVVGFTCQVAGRTIVGEVKEKEEAKAVFDQAVSQGQTAALLDQVPNASDVFTTTIGNVPAGAKIIVQITYLGELKHDMEVDGVRFTIPTVICPRYGDFPYCSSLHTASNIIQNGISITIDAEMAEGSFIQQMRSPTHPIAMSMGTTTTAPNAEPSMNKASATLSLGTVHLDKDFVVQIVAKDTGVPKAILETHPTIPNQRALMATLVPKFSLPPEMPEVVFVCDRSGSMSGSGIALAVQALKVFLKSLPLGVKFNICSFGSSYSFLWPRSVTYSQQTLQEATLHVETFQANYGGTEMLMPLKAAIANRWSDMPLDVMLLTDGSIWNQQELFDHLNDEITTKKTPLRVFTLGVGSGASTALIEGVARAGNGFAQTVADGEKMDAKVVRMLKGALSPHIDDYTLEVKYSEELDDFELVERVVDSLNVKLDLNDEKQEDKPKPISLFDPAANPDAEHHPKNQTKYSHLPKIAIPKIIEAPLRIPTLFAFNRTTVYLLLGPDAPREMPISVTLRGTSKHGPLELEIPIQVLDTPGETIHQLAAKRAIVELEQGRGWLTEAKDAETGELLKKKCEGRFQDMVEREAVRLGVQFQVGGKYCSFVAVEKNGSPDQANADGEWWDAKGTRRTFALDERLQEDVSRPSFGGGVSLGRLGPSSPSTSRKKLQLMARQEMDSGSTPQPLMMQQQQQQQQQQRLHMPPSGQALQPQMCGFSMPATQSLGGMTSVDSWSVGRPQSTGYGLSPSQSHGSTPSPLPSTSGYYAAQPKNPFAPSPAQTTSFNSAAARYSPTSSSPVSNSPALFGGSSSSSTTAQPAFGSANPAPWSPQPATFNPFTPFSGARAAPPPPPPAPSAYTTTTPQTDDAILTTLISLQSFSGYWDLEPALLSAISLSESSAEALLKAKEISDVDARRKVATAIAVAYMETRLVALRNSWELVVEKARRWLEGEEEGEALVGRVKGAGFW